MAKCLFCNETLGIGTGKMIIEKNGKISWFCSKKCEKNTTKLGRDPRKFKWAKPAKS